MPESDEQTVIMDLIYSGVKAGNSEFDVTKTREVMDRMIKKGCEILILGCTELPVAMDMYNLDYPVCDPTLELAKGAILAAGGKCTK